MRGMRQRLLIVTGLLLVSMVAVSGQVVFEVASIRRNTVGFAPDVSRIEGGRYTASNMTLDQLKDLQASRASIFDSLAKQHHIIMNASGVKYDKQFENSNKMRKN